MSKQTVNERVKAWYWREKAKDPIGFRARMNAAPTQVRRRARRQAIRDALRVLREAVRNYPYDAIRW